MSSSVESAGAVTLAVELTSDDVVKAHFWALSQMPLVRLLGGVNVLLLLASLLLALRSVARGETPPLVLALAVVPLGVFFVFFPLTVRRQARASFVALGEAERRGTYRFTEDGFQWTLGRTPGRASWTAVTAARETGHRLFFLTPGGRAHVLPKAEASDEDLARLRRLLDARSSRTPC